MPAVARTGPRSKQGARNTVLVFDISGRNPVTWTITTTSHDLHEQGLRSGARSGNQTRAVLCERKASSLLYPVPTPVCASLAVRNVSLLQWRSLDCCTYIWFSTFVYLWLQPKEIVLMHGNCSSSTKMYFYQESKYPSLTIMDRGWQIFVFNH